MVIGADSAGDPQWIDWGRLVQRVHWQYADVFLTRPSPAVRIRAVNRCNGMSAAATSTLQSASAVWSAQARPHTAHTIHRRPRAVLLQLSQQTKSEAQTCMRISGERFVFVRRSWQVCRERCHHVLLRDDAGRLHWASWGRSDAPTRCRRMHSSSHIPIHVQMR